jgi:hypothetical protein
MQKKVAVALVASFFVALCSAAVSQAVTVTAKNSPEPNEENLLLNSGLSGTTVTGTTNQTGGVFLLTGTETLTEPSNGQARVEAVDGSFTYLAINAETGTTFQDIILNPFLGDTGNRSGSLTFEIFLAGGSSVTSGPWSLTQGNNFFTIVAGAGESIIGIALTESGNYQLHDVRQIRISGVCIDCTAPPVAEPTTLAMLGTSMLGLVGFASRLGARR